MTRLTKTLTKSTSTTYPMSEDDAWVMPLEEDEIEDLQEGVDLVVDVPGQFIANNPTIVVRKVDNDSS